MDDYEEIKTKSLTELEKEINSLIYNQAPVGFFILDKKGFILDMNQKSVEILKSYSEKKQNIKKFISHSYHSIFNEYLNNIFEKKGTQKCTVHLLNQNNQEIQIEFEGTSFTNHETCFISAMEIENTSSLKHSEIRYQKLFESSKDGILILNAENGNIIDINYVLTEMIGVGHNEIIGQRVWETYVFKQIIDCEETFKSLSPKSDLQLFSLITAAGKIIDVEVLSNIYKYGNKTEMQWNFRDVSERRKYEKELESNKLHLEELNVAKNKFFSIISHDLRSPFNSIIGFCELLTRKIHDKDYESIEHYADKIQQASWHAMNLLSNLMEWSRSQNNKIELKPETFKLSIVINEVFNYTIDAAEQKSIDLINTAPADLEIFADRSMLNTIIRNLITNGIKFTNCGGHIIVNAINKDRETIISICDNGIGMDSTLQSNLFKIDQCYSHKGTNEEKGTGLGLLLCKEFVQKHKGNIWVDSKAGEGSCFYFSIPKQEK